MTIASGERHWEIFQHLCHEANAKGNLIPDAYLAALAIESAWNGSPSIEITPAFPVFDGDIH